VKEKFTFGYFQTLEAAQKAAAALKERGFEAYVDRFSPIGGGTEADGDDRLRNPFMDQSLSLAESTMGSPPPGNDERILWAAHPDASGLAGSNGFDTPEDVCVTVFAKDEQMKEVREILKSFGARD
jgi:hypothetical protein